jgi:hypothetical protein
MNCLPKYQHTIWFYKIKNKQKYSLIYEQWDLQVTCVISKLSCVGKTSHNLKQRYQEHVRYIQQNNLQSVYALHILNNKYEYGPINNTASFLRQVNKGPLLIPFEQVYI